MRNKIMTKLNNLQTDDKNMQNNRIDENFDSSRNSGSRQHEQSDYQNTNRKAGTSQQE